MEDEDVLKVGFWCFSARVEMRPVQLPEKVRKEVGSPEAGDVWYRMVLDVSFNDDTGEHGMWGELSTAWQDGGIKYAREQAMLLQSMHVCWEEYDEETDEYVIREATAAFAALYDRAVERFQLVAPAIVQQDGSVELEAKMLAKDDEIEKLKAEKTRLERMLDEMKPKS